MRSLALYSLRSLAVYNREKLSDSEREFSDTRSRLNREAIKKNGYCIPSKPRSLRYYFVAELCSPGCGEGASFERLMSAEAADSSSLVEHSLTSFGSDVELVKEASNLFSKVSTRLKLNSAHFLFVIFVF